MRRRGKLPDLDWSEGKALEPRRLCDSMMKTVIIIVTIS